MLKLLADVDRVGPTASSVLIVGESGTGKERVAAALHEVSGRAGSLVTIDCGALPSNLLASELFGHERGSFTGADRTHIGAFERAGGGTVFLDEIGELPQADQATLLGVLERRRFRRVGGSADVTLGARVIAATNRDLRAEVNHGRFRHDLYHRLAVVVLRIPPLRERPEDIAPLVEHFARQLGVGGSIEAAFGVEQLARWRRRTWTGNARELRNAVEAAIVAGPEADVLELATDAPAPYKDARAAQLTSFERTYLADIMDRAQGNVSKAARIARMDRSYLIELLQRHGLR
jgi:DNA-binding NtrC family response regulator